jgi:hypothetical protein
MNSHPFVAAIGSLFILGLVVTPAGAATRVHSTTYDFGFALPSRWENLPLGAGNDHQLVERATNHEASLAKALTKVVISASADGIAVLAVGPVTENFNPNINVSESPASTYTGNAKKIKGIIGEVRRALASAGIKHASTSLSRGPFGDTLNVVYSIQLKTAGVLAHGVQLYARHGNRVFVVTTTSTSAAAAASLARGVAHSWSWSPN